MRKRLAKLSALLLAMLMAITTLAHPVFGTVDTQEAEAIPYLERAYTADDLSSEEVFTVSGERRERHERDEHMPYEHMDFLLSTLTHEPIRMFGFEDHYALSDNPDEMVEIVVQFRTPSAVAQRLIQEAESPRARSGGRAMDAAFAPAALEGHASFMNELSTIPMPLSATGSMEIFSEHHMLFNGVFMRVPVGMVESIAMLPEVFAVTPAMTPYTLQDLEAMASGTFGIEPASGTIYDQAMLRSMLDGSVLVVSDNFQDYDYEWHPEFNQGAREMFELDYINNEMGLTGAGVRVGIIDTGIDYRHPAYWHMLIPVEDGAGFVRDASGQYWSLPGGNFMTAPASGRASGRSTSPMEMIHGANHSTHGTHVAGITLGMAPGVQLYGFRILTSEPGGAGLAQAPMQAIEYAYYLGLDVVNNSWGYTGSTNHPWFSFTWATNVAALAGMVSTNATGNDGLGGPNPTAGLGGWFSLGGGGSSASLGISVASGRGGNRHMFGLGDAEIDGIAAPTLVISGVPTWYNVQTDLPAGDLDYTWFGRYTVPARSYFNNAANAAAWLQTFRDNNLNGGDLDGQIAVFARGGGEFLSYHFIAHQLGAVGLILTNNAPGPITGTTHNTPNAGDPPLQIPNFSMGLAEGTAHFGEPLPVPSPPLTGTINLGGISAALSPDDKTPSSSIGPLGPVGTEGFGGALGPDGTPMDAIMHIFPCITAPGANIVSTWTISAPATITGRPYNSIGGTSMAGPAIAGIAALLIEQIDAPMTADRAVEVQARIMQTARPLEGYDGQYSVNQVGAGVVNPLAALTTTAYATTVHPIPFTADLSGIDDIPYQQVPNAWRVFEDHTMSSLSFGRVAVEEDESTSTATLPITIHGEGTWTLDRVEMRMPTQELRNPATGSWGGNWGPQLQFTVTGVEYNYTSTGVNSYEIYFTHDGALANRGFAEGHIYFTDGNGGEIFMMFGAYFDVEVPPPPAAPLQPLATNAIWRPVLSNWMTTPYNYGEADPRAFSVVHPGASWFLPGDIGTITRSNFSPLNFGFVDPNDGPDRSLYFYFAPYGYDIDDAVRFGSAAPLASGAATTYTNVVRSIKGGNLDTINSAQGVHVIWGNATVLDAGVYTLFVRVVHGAGEEYDLVQPFTFVVVDDRPTIEFDSAFDSLFFYEDGDVDVTISGRVNSTGHDLAIEHELYTRVSGGAFVPFDYSTVELWSGNTRIFANADGTFEFTVSAAEATHEMDVVDGLGTVVLPVIPALNLWNWNALSATHVSLIHSFDVAPMPEFGFNIFNNGPGGTQYPRPNASLAAAGTIRMWTQLDGVNAPIYLAAADTIVALDQDGECAMAFITVPEMWQPGGFLPYFSRIDADKNQPWQYINLYITVLGQTVHVLLVNDLFEELPVFSLDIFNNGPVELGATPSRPNASLAAAGTIRMWTQLDGVNARVLYAELDVVAELPDGSCAMEFITVNRIWNDQDWTPSIDANKNLPWERIYLTATLFGQAIDVVLVNSLFEQPPVFGLDIFNNGPVELGATPSRPNASLAAAGTVRMWTQLDGVNARVLYAELDVVAELPDGSCAMEFITVNRIWNDQDWTPSIDANKNLPWERIYLTATLFGQAIDVVLVNSDYVPAGSSHTVTFTVEAGAVGVYLAPGATTTVEVPHGEAIPAGSIPNSEARVGFYFAGWDPMDPSEHGNVYGNLAFTARFNPLFHYVTFEVGYGGVPMELSPVLVRDGFTVPVDNVPYPEALPGFVFVGWVIDGTVVGPESVIVRNDLTFTAVFDVE